MRMAPTFQAPPGAPYVKCHECPMGSVISESRPVPSYQYTVWLPILSKTPARTPLLMNS